MSRIKTIIIEDELIIAEDMKGMLSDLEHEVIGIASDCAEAEEILANETPDIALIDIHLRGNDDGIELAKMIRRKYDIPLIFVTSYSDKDTVSRAKQVLPEGYIIKPFEKADLITSIEIALYNYSKRAASASMNQPPDKEDPLNVVIRDSIFIRKDYMLIKIRFDDLIWIKSEMNYLELHCKEAMHLIRSTLREFLDKLPPHAFLQIHKSYCINIKYITAIDHSNIWLEGLKLPIGRAYSDSVKSVLKLEL